MFDSIAPEMLQRSIWSWRGADPLLSKKFNNWLIADYQWTPFNDILPTEEPFEKLPEVPPLEPDSLDKNYHDLLVSLQERFYGDPHRWDASRRDQFIILGMLASEGGYGVRQGKLVHHLGMGLSPVAREDPMLFERQKLPSLDWQTHTASRCLHRQRAMVPNGFMPLPTNIWLT